MTREVAAINDPDAILQELKGEAAACESAPVANLFPQTLPCASRRATLTTRRQSASGR